MTQVDTLSTINTYFRIWIFDECLFLESVPIKNDSCSGGHINRLIMKTVLSFRRIEKFYFSEFVIFGYFYSIFKIFFLFLKSDRFQIRWSTKKSIYLNNHPSYFISHTQRKKKGSKVLDKKKNTSALYEKRTRWPF
jgi:hypothetical protein